MRAFKTGVILMAAIVFLCSGHVFSMDMQNFSADMVSRANGQMMQGKIYVSGKKVRTEMAGSIMIARPDLNVAYVIMPAERMYMEQAINMKMLPKTSDKLEGEVERVSLGKEVIDGNQTEKFKVVYIEGGMRAEAYQWLMDSGFPVKMEAVDGTWSVEYKNISLNAPSDDLFEPPAGYQKLSMPFAGGFNMQ